MKLFLVLLALVASPFTATSQCPRKVAYDDYQNSIIKTHVPTDQLNWTGNSASCIPGTISNVVKENMIARINYFRRIFGVPKLVTHAPEKDTVTQRAALIMEANDLLTHYPPNTASCYTPAGYSAASQSLLSDYSPGGTGGVVDFILDFGDGNEMVGHRRCLLSPQQEKFGIGATPNVTGINVYSPWVSYSGIEYFSFPGKGYVPNLYLDDLRWSFSMKGANFSNATVEMTKPNGNAVLMTEPIRYNHTLDPTIVWVPDRGEVVYYSNFDITYKVHIKNILVSGVSKNISYDVIAFNPTIYPPACSTGTTWSETDCNCLPKVTGISNDSNIPSVQISPNPFEQTFHIALTDGAAYQVHSIEGLVIESGVLVGSSTLGLNWKAGIYFITITDEDGKIKKQKVVKF